MVISSAVKSDYDGKSTLSEYVPFLVRDLNPQLLRRIRKQAKAESLPVVEVMRQVLCAHYSLDCIPSRHSPRQEYGSRTKLLRLQPELHEAIQRDSEQTGVSMQALAKEALEFHYAVT